MYQDQQGHWIKAECQLRLSTIGGNALTTGMVYDEPYASAMGFYCAKPVNLKRFEELPIRVERHILGEPS
jgi:hypothetical protein